MLKLFDTYVRGWIPRDDDEGTKVPANAEDICLNAVVFVFVWGIGA